MKNMNVRPTSEKVIQGIFNIMGSSVSGAAFLDLFAGTGRVSKEALRRGAYKVCLVENHKFAIRKLREDLHTQSNLDVDIIGMDVRRALQKLVKEGRAFDIIFADPPYGKGWPKILIDDFSLLLAKLLKNEGVLVLEHSCREDVPPSNQHFVLTSTRQYGETCISFYRKNGVMDQ